MRASLQPLAAEKGLEFVTTVSADIHLAYGDSGRITQCLMNLAGNALKFTHRGRVELGVELRGDVLVYRVADTGIGIAPDKLETVFAEFRQGDATITSEFGGTKTMLHVEDNELNRKIIRDLLRRTSCRLIEAPDGEAAVAAAREQHPDLILMDVQLPKVSGIEATRRVRAEPATAHIPIIAITSFALSGDEQRASRGVGVSGETVQPVHASRHDSEAAPRRVNGGRVATRTNLADRNRESRRLGRQRAATTGMREARRH